MRLVRFVIAPLALTALLLASSAQAQPGAAEPDEETRGMIQASLDNWETICRRFLRIDPEPLPWMIFYDDKQAWHLSADLALLPPHQEQPATPFLFNGKPRRLIRVPHDNTALWVPTGRLPIGPGKPPHAFTTPYDDGARTFFVLPLPPVIRALAGERARSLEPLFIGLAAHELAHTRQLVDVMRRIRTLREKHDVPTGIDDNFIQQKYGADPEYARAFLEEEDRFFRAVMEESDRDASRRLLLEALALADRRRAQFFAGPAAVHAELENIFLVMEGVGEWVGFQLRRQATPASSWQQTLTETIGDSGAWSKRHGLALFMLIDRFVPDWQRGFLAPDFPSPFVVLREALATPAGK